MIRFWPQSLVLRLTLWAFLLFLVSIPILWVAFLKGAERVSENVVDTQIIELATQLRGYRAAAINASKLQVTASDFSVSAPILIGDVDWVWQFSSKGEPVVKSELLNLSDLTLPLTLAPSRESFLLQNVETPVGRMRIAGRAIDESVGEKAPKIVHYIVGLSQDRYQDRVKDHAERLQELILIGVLPISIGILGMLILVVLTLRATFVRLDEAIAHYEKDGGSDIEGKFPREIQALVDRTNRILRQNQLLIERTRKYVSKIAHDINHPLAVLKNSLKGEVDPALADRQIQRMTGLIDRYASLARAIGPETGSRKTVQVAPLLADTADGFSIMYRRTPLEIDYLCDNNLRALMPRYDLETIISNLVSNAHKYAKSRVEISVIGVSTGLRLLVEDDGPGISEDRRDDALNWGGRLDEAPPGTGFGLSIVCDIIELYEGTISLDRSEKLGGLKVQIDLPVIAMLDKKGSY